MCEELSIANGSCCSLSSVKVVLVPFLLLPSAHFIEYYDQDSIHAMILGSHNNIFYNNLKNKF